MAFVGCKVLPNISMHAVDMSFQSRDLRDKNGTFVSRFLSRLVDVYTFSLQLNCQINEERGSSITFTQYISYLKNPALDRSLTRFISITMHIAQGS